MIDTSAPRDPIDLHAILARIDRDLTENAKLLVEVQKSNDERRDRWYVPLIVFGMILAAVIARLPEILHAFGWPS